MTNYLSESRRLMTWLKTLPRETVAKVADRSDELSYFTQTAAEVYELAAVSTDQITAQKTLAEMIASIYLMGYVDGQNTPDLRFPKSEEFEHAHDCAKCRINKTCPLPQASEFRGEPRLSDEEVANKIIEMMAKGEI